MEFNPPPRMASSGASQILNLEGPEETGGVQLLLDNLEEITEALKKERCDYVSIVAVMGTYRTGKSFLLDLLMRYLRTRSTRETKQDGDVDNAGVRAKPKTPWSIGTEERMPVPDWVEQGDATHISEGRGGQGDTRGFGWRSGKDKCTNGIWLWGQPFVLHDLQGRRIGVLLMDTQGAWDSQMTADQSATIFGLTALLSSKLIYNIQNRIETDKIDNLDYFTSFAEKACGVIHQNVENPSTKAPFGQLSMLIRDWCNYEEGWDLGKCKAQMDEHLDDHIGPQKVPADAREKVERLKSCFSNIDCFGLVHPGTKVARPSWDGGIADIDRDFLYLLDSYTEQFFGDNFPCPSAPLGCEMRVDTFSQTVRNFADAFANSRGMALGLREAFVKVQMMQEREQLLKAFRAWMEAQYPEHMVVDPNNLSLDITSTKEEYEKRLRNMLKPFKLKPDDENEFIQELLNDLDIVSKARISANMAQVEGATMKVVASPVVGLGAYIAATHIYIASVVAALGAWVEMKKHSNRNNVELFHPEVFQGLMEDGREFMMNRYRDIQAMQIAVTRINVNTVMEGLMGATIKAQAAVAAASAAASGPDNAVEDKKAK